MRNLKGWPLLLLLGAPLALYAALAVRAVARTDLVSGEPPPDRGATKEQLAALRAKSAAWLAEVRKAGSVAAQFRAPAADETSSDPLAAGALKAAGARAADLGDLDRFLSGVTAQPFTGSRKEQFAQWQSGQKELARAAAAVGEWLDRAPPVRTAAEADAALGTVAQLIDAYTARSQFADRGRAAEWKLRARLHVADGLTAAAEERHAAALNAKLPLAPGANAVRAALEALEALRGHLAALPADLKRAEADGAKVPADLRERVAALGAVAEGAAARAELLGLFARDDLFTNPTGAAAWLKAVAARYERAPDDKARAQIREKVQEFCDAFLPPAALLDDEVLLRGKGVPRKHLVVKYAPVAGAAPVRKPLAAEVDGPNEVTLATRPPGENVFVVHEDAEHLPGDLKPTPLSAAAVAYTAARQKPPAGAAGPRWSARSVEALKLACEGQRELVDQLKVPGGGGDPKLWARLSGLAAGARAHPELFGAK